MSDYREWGDWLHAQAIVLDREEAVEPDSGVAVCLQLAGQNLREAAKQLRLAGRIKED